MHPAAGIAIVLVASVLAVVTGGRLRTSLPRPAIDALMAVAGAGLGVGGLLMLDDVSTASWIAAPAVLAVVAALHVRALFAREGPFRT
ncbi:MAG: hypothetical protein ACXWEG_00245 [Actinomycetota bacterium]